MIYVTGDTHGTKDFTKLLSPELSRLTKRDYVIVLGDIGVLFDPKMAPYFINLYSYLPYTVLFVDGNHENFDLLNSYPVSYWHGGKVHKISKSVYHLMRGQVFKIAGKRIFTFGGALSFDKARRKEGESWWPSEMPNEAEYKEGVKNLEKYGNRVDFVVSHDCPAALMNDVAKHSRKLQHEGIIISKSNEYFDKFASSLNFDKWYFAHYHIDVDFDKKYSCLFERLIKIK